LTACSRYSAAACGGGNSGLSTDIPAGAALPTLSSGHSPDGRAVSETRPDVLARSPPKATSRRLPAARDGAGCVRRPRAVRVGLRSTAAPSTSPTVLSTGDFERGLRILVDVD